MNADRESARSDGHWITSLVLPILCALAICGPAFARASDPGYRPRVAVGLYAWVQDRARRGMSVDEDLDGVLGEVRGAGLRAVEGFLDFFASDAAAERTRTLLAKHRVVLAGVYTGGVLYEETAADKTIAAILDKAKRARHFPGVYIDVNPDPLPGGRRKTDEQLAVQVRMLNRLGSELAAMGLPLVIHQHAPEIRFEAREQRYNVAHVDTSVVGFCMDTHWLHRGGQDALTLLKEAGRGTKVLHLRNSENGVWSESFGPGDVDYGPIAAYLREQRFNGWLVLELAYEKDTRVTRSLVENHRLGRQYLESVFLDSAADGSSRYGGWAQLRGTPTGWFHTEQIDGRSWIVDPDGQAFFSKGVNHVSDTADRAPTLGYSPYGRVTGKKYGTAERFAQAAVGRLAGWGFNTIGAWSSAETFEQQMPYTVILNLGARAGANWRTGAFPDVFSDAFQEKVRAAAVAGCADRAADPYLLGYFTDNELRWGPDWRSKRSLLEDYLTLPADAAGKQAAVAHVLEHFGGVSELNRAAETHFGSRQDVLRATRFPSTVSVDSVAGGFVRIVASRYFAVCHDAIRTVDPYHLILGCRFAGRAREDVLKGAGPWVDVISFNSYGTLPPMKTMNRIHEITGRPVMLTEFSFKAMDSGLPNTRGAGRPVPTQTDRANRFADYVRALAAMPYVVGYHWFEHADEPAEGRFDGENSNYGVVNIRDEPWSILVREMTRVNGAIEFQHAEAP